ncbi:hypothetical protein C8R42DRAFT_715175 [Lentinula raphanica]|nr:hypothetical protein C8R42DRAFT_715175 [Lentinula raphanica]
MDFSSHGRNVRTRELQLPHQPSANSVAIALKEIRLEFDNAKLNASLDKFVNFSFGETITALYPTPEGESELAW